MNSPITKLIPEILLKIFEWIGRDCDATLVASILCCKNWRPLAESVLYSDVFLNVHRLTRFLDTYTDRQIRSLTLVMDPVPVHPYDRAFAARTVTARLEALQRLSSHIKKMALISFSITINFPFPHTASLELSSIINNLSDSCTCLEIDTKHSGFIDVPSTDFNNQPTSPVCDAIRTILPRLKHLRLRRPQLCSALFGTKSHEQDAGFEAVRATNLKSCLINLSLRTPGRYPGTLAAPCGASAPFPLVGLRPRFPYALIPLLPGLQAFARLNSASLERLWIVDEQSRDPDIPNSWAAWVRRDILSDTSVPIPIHSIRGFCALMVRIPAEPGRTEDWLSSQPERLEALAEGYFWSQTTNGIRLPTPMLREYDRVPRPVTKELIPKEHRPTCSLWENEEITGEKLLPEAPGPLMKEWDLKERTPIGWTRKNHADSSMVRVKDVLVESLELISEIRKLH